MSSSHDQLHAASYEETYHDLIRVLRIHGVAYDAWGLHGTKTIDDLCSELCEGESILEERGGELIRKIQAVGVDVFADIDGVRRILREDRQEFSHDGTIKRRQLSTSLGEKIKQGESPRIAMIRALREELGVDVSDDSVHVGNTEYQLSASTIYPGLVSEKMLIKGAVLLAPDQVNPDGYVECQATKCTYFSWNLLPEFAACNADGLTP